MMLNETDAIGDKPQKRGSGEAAKAPGPEEDLKACCEELAERVRNETLSRRSMQEILREKFPQFSDAQVVHYMLEALRSALEEEGQL